MPPEYFATRIISGFATRITSSVHVHLRAIVNTALMVMFVLTPSKILNFESEYIGTRGGTKYHVPGTSTVVAVEILVLVAVDN